MFREKKLVIVRNEFLKKFGFEVLSFSSLFQVIERAVDCKCHASKLLPKNQSSFEDICHPTSKSRVEKRNLLKRQIYIVIGLHNSILNFVHTKSRCKVMSSGEPLVSYIAAFHWCLIFPILLVICCSHPSSFISDFRLTGCQEVISSFGEVNSNQCLTSLFETASLQTLHVFHEHLKCYWCLT